MTSRQKLKYRIVDTIGEGNRSNEYTEYFNYFIEILVLVNVAAVILESFEDYSNAYHIPFYIFEAFTVTIFTLEFSARIWVADIAYPAKTRFKSIKRYLFSPGAMIDILAIVPFFVPYIVKVDLRHLRILRLARLLRVFKLDKYMDSMKLIARIMREKRKELMATLLLTFSVLVVASSLMYYLEREVQPGAFQNILQAFWWGICTLTTVGYGDIYPMTPIGKLLGAIVAMMGVMIVAIPTGIISSSFVQKMDETNYRKRMSVIRRKLKEAFYKKHIPELGCKVRRGQLSVDAVKVSLELAEQDIYKIAEGKNEFRFRIKKVMSNGMMIDKMYLEYREINTEYGTFTNRKNQLTLISPESLSKQSIGYFVYCLSEKLKCNYLSNEFYENESNISEESFGDKGLELDSSFNFKHNKVYLQAAEEEVPTAFYQWMSHIRETKGPNGIHLIFNLFEQENGGLGFLHLTFLKKKTGTLGEEYTYTDVAKVQDFIRSLEVKAEERFDKKLKISTNTTFQSVRENNLLLYIRDYIDSDTLLININKDYLMNEKLFNLASIMAESIREELIGV